jgi:hypothetical protein
MTISLVVMILAIIFSVMYFAIPLVDQEGSVVNTAKSVIISLVLLLSSGLFYNFGK